ncbi:MAG: hydrolase or metal-binding protein [Piscirickettsiaceae bacterium CG_4_9_14_3_um_filter_43_564]|nr:MAG: hydrolase or metal-binding protein [Piscirickettsiaceae bacterium CG18_big_fil_WC_8_21_14_2_50_44_103]PIU38731.1 MAG: hydrolase or metal-binding protein [Piscirickettsiaceae bacterium CG07_land_8_20_14_0_80_44_28]PJA66653.1 MAG: hydrolase or metal-binding protein [Piscirickettsiaceae bacterium CG_4_9_14_3_um_filter_43_564]
MLKGLMITPPMIGRITIGQVVEKNGKRLPQKDDQFTITSQIQTTQGWIKHPFDEQLRDGQKKLRSIPVQLMFNDPDLNLRAEYCLFDRQTARPICIGNGESCSRNTQNGYETLPCPSPDHCELAQSGCKPYGRLNVVVTPESEQSDDPIGSFVFRTSGFNSIRTLASRLSYFQALSGNRLACLPLALKVRGKSTRQSFGKPIYYVDLTLRTGLDLQQTLEQAKQLDAHRKEMGFDQDALDKAAKVGFANGHFEDDEDTVETVLEEFYPPNTAQQDQGNQQPNVAANLNERLAQQTQSLNA